MLLSIPVQSHKNKTTKRNTQNPLARLEPRHCRQREVSEMGLLMVERVGIALNRTAARQAPRHSPHRQHRRPLLEFPYKSLEALHTLRLNTYVPVDGGHKGLNLF